MIDNIVDALQKFLDSRFENIHTIIPAKIENYDAIKRKATVTPLVTKKTKDGDDIELPTIENVPVMFNSSAGFSLVYPLKRDDTCLLLFAETGIGNWLNGGGDIASADSATRFALTDAICIPGFYTFSSVPDSQAILEITSSFKFIIANQFEDLFSVFDALITEIGNIITTGSPVSQTVSPASKALLEIIRTRAGLLLEAK